jgi:hypothetical protein
VGLAIPALIKLLEYKDSGVVSSVVLLLGELAGHGEWAVHGEWQPYII